MTNKVHNNRLDLIVPSVWGLRLSALMTLGLPVSAVANTTLNEKLSINHRSQIGVNDKLATRWYCIGYGGHRSVRVGDDVDLTDIVRHRPTDAGLFKHYPFVMRRVGDDLTDIERQQYGLRRIEEHNGVRYICYYAKRFTVENQVRVMKETMSNGTVTHEDYVATQSNLNPLPPTISPNQAEITSNTKIHVSTGSVIQFSAQDVTELFNVARILRGNEALAIISEIGIITCAEERVSGEDGVSYTELKGATISTFINTRRELIFNTDGFRENLWVGEKTPLLIDGMPATTIGG